jgi:hypothetical protein
LDGRGWIVFESEDFERGAVQCGGLAIVEEVIAPIKYALSRNPLGFPPTGIAEVRLARTKLRINGPDLVLSHTVWFRAHTESSSVELLWVEVTSPDQMDWSESEFPF